MATYILGYWFSFKFSKNNQGLQKPWYLPHVGSRRPQEFFCSLVKIRSKPIVDKVTSYLTDVDLPEKNNVDLKPKWQKLHM